MARSINQNTTDAALKIVAAFGIENLDALHDYERVACLKNMAGELRKQTGVTYYTSRQHIARACRLERGRLVRERQTKTN